LLLDVDLADTVNRIEAAVGTNPFAAPLCTHLANSIQRTESISTRVERESIGIHPRRKPLAMRQQWRRVQRDGHQLLLRAQLHQRLADRIDHRACAATRESAGRSKLAAGSASPSVPQSGAHYLRRSGCARRPCGTDGVCRIARSFRPVAPTANGCRRWRSRESSCCRR
jgi:hypothetical protein